MIRDTQQEREKLINKAISAIDWWRPDEVVVRFPHGDVKYNVLLEGVEKVEHTLRSMNMHRVVAITLRRNGYQLCESATPKEEIEEHSPCC
jgi:hypothetical protein